MDNHFTKTKNFLQKLNFNIYKEDIENGILVINKENSGIKNLIIGVAYPIIIIEQFIFKVNEPNEDIFKNLLIKNRDIVHGAFVLDHALALLFARKLEDLCHQACPLSRQTLHQ